MVVPLAEAAVGDCWRWGGVGPIGIGAAWVSREVACLDNVITEWDVFCGELEAGGVFVVHYVEVACLEESEW